MNTIATMTNPQLTDNTVAVFATHDQAEEAVRTLSRDGFDIKNLSVIGQNYSTAEQPVGFVNGTDRMWTWGKFGAFWGAMWGLLFGSAMLVIPGIGPVMFAGWIVSALEGALIGGGIAALGGALAGIGIPDNSVIQYEAAIKAGSFILIAHGSEAEVMRAKDFLSTTGATRVDSYATKPLAGVR
jgi:uncharacterized membrane protein